MADGWSRAEVLDAGGSLPKPRDSHVGRCVTAVVPAYLYRVTVPLPPRRPVNLFERLVLSLARSGEAGAAAIQDHASLPALFAERLVHDLERRGFLDVRGSITERGAAVLEGEEEEEEPRFDVRYVLQDAIGGQLMPGGLTLEECDDLVVAGDDVLRARRSDQRSRTTVVLEATAGGQAFGPPSVSEVLDAVPAALKGLGVEFLDPRPTRCRLVVTAHAPTWAVDPHDWIILPPHCTALSHAWRSHTYDLLSKAAATSDDLREAIESMMHNSLPDPSTLSEFERAARYVRDALGEAVARRPGLQRYLVGLQTGLYRAEAISRRESRRESNVEWELLEAMEPASTSAGRAAENSLKAILKTHPYQGVPATTTVPNGAAGAEKREAWERNADLLSHALDVLGYAEHPKGGAPHGLVSACQDVRGASDGSGKRKLRSMIVMATLQATQEEAHPLRSAAAHHPTLIVDLDEVASRRNPATHDDDDEARTLSLQTLRDDADVIFRLARIALDTTK